jgi:hypothetical protein
VTAEEPVHSYAARSGAPGRLVAMILACGALAGLVAGCRLSAEMQGRAPTLVTAAGLPAPQGQPLVHYSHGVEVKVGTPRLL